MSLRAKMFALLTAGTAAFLIATALFRGVIERQNGRNESGIAASLAADDAQFEARRRCDRLVVRLTSWQVAAEQSLRAESAGDETATSGRSAESFWKRFVELSDLEAGETLVLLTAGGDVLAAEGPYAGDVTSLGDKLRLRGLGGRAGANGIRSGVVGGGESPEIAVSVTVPEGLTEASERLGAVPGTSLRSALVAPLDLAKTIERIPTAEINLYALRGEDLPPRLREIAADLWRNKGAHSDVSGEGTEVVRAIEDAAGRAAFLLAARSRSETAGVLMPALVLESLVWEALAAFLAILLALRFVDMRVLRPMDEIQRRATRLARTEHGSLAFHSSESGEFGELASALDSMLAKIQADRSEFVRSARIAGMSDVSMGVVHSAGNILNSVNVSTKVLSKEIGAIGIEDMRAMIAELQEHKDDLGAYVTDDPKGQFFIPFLAAMTEALDDLRTRCLVELESVEHGVAHVVDLIRSQEKYAIGASVVETTHIGEVVDMAVNIAMLANDRSGEIEFDRSYADLPAVRVDRHKLTSILINIVSNAIEALTDDAAVTKRLELSIYEMTDDLFVIEVTDTGVGIAPENLDSIFNSAFSTKEDSTGEGLHTTANLCKELGIAIGAVSEGVGFGTTFKLRVPFEPPGSGEEAEAGRSSMPNPAPALPSPRFGAGDAQDRGLDRSW